MLRWCSSTARHTSVRPDQPDWLMINTKSLPAYFKNNQFLAPWKMSALKTLTQRVGFSTFFLNKEPNIFKYKKKKSSSLLFNLLDMPCPGRMRTCASRQNVIIYNIQVSIARWWILCCTCWGSACTMILWPGKHTSVSVWGKSCVMFFFIQPLVSVFISI